jgi:hypothetical protein
VGGWVAMVKVSSPSNAQWMRSWWDAAGTVAYSIEVGLPAPAPLYVVLQPQQDRTSRRAAALACRGAKTAREGASGGGRRDSGPQRRLLFKGTQAR